MILVAAVPRLWGRVESWGGEGGEAAHDQAVVKACPQKNEGRMGQGGGEGAQREPIRKRVTSNPPLILLRVPRLWGSGGELEGRRGRRGGCWSSSWLLPAQECEGRRGGGRLGSSAAGADSRAYPLPGEYDTGHPLGCGDPVTDIVRDVQRKRFAQGAVFGSDPTPASRATTGVDETWSVQQSDSLGIRPIQFKYHCMRNRRFVRICYTRSSHACVHCERAMEKTF